MECIMIHNRHAQYQELLKLFVQEQLPDMARQI